MSHESITEHFVENAPEPAPSIEKKEKTTPRQTDLLIFDAPFHTDPSLSGQALDDSGMSKEIPRGALSVATLLERRGFEANVVPMDAFLDQRLKEDQARIDEIRKEHFADQEQASDQLQNDVANESLFIESIRKTIYKQIKEQNPKVVAFSYMFSPNERSIMAMARFVKQNFPEKTVIIGGNAATFDQNSQKQLLDPEKVGVDAIVNYEGEWTMLDIIEAIKEGKGENTQVNFEKIKGLSYWKEGGVISTGRRERGNPIEIGPLNYNQVMLPEGMNIGDFNHYVLFARGCLGRCAFCTSSEMYHRVITHIGLESFRDELNSVIEAVSQRKGEEKNIGILDDDLLLELWFDADGNTTDKEASAVEKKTVFEVIAPVLKEAHQKHPEINFIAQARVGHLRSRDDKPVEKKQNPRANTLVEKPESLLTEMKESGINFVLLGIESGSQEILDASLKDTRVEWVEPACNQLKSAGIGVGAFWIIGLPGATKEREEQSLAFLKYLVDNELIDELESHVFVPLPGSSARTSPIIGRDLKFDQNINETSKKALFNNQATFEHINSSGDVVLSKPEIQQIFEQTKELAAILKKRNEKNGHENIVKP